MKFVTASAAAARAAGRVAHPHQRLPRQSRRSGEILEYHDEQEQATYLRELLDVFTAEGVDATFVCYGLPHRPTPATTSTCAGAGLARVTRDHLDWVRTPGGGGPIVE